MPAKAPPNHVYSYEKTTMVRIPTDTKKGLQELAILRCNEESLGQLITTLYRQELDSINTPALTSEEVEALRGLLQSPSNQPEKDS